MVSLDWFNAFENLEVGWTLWFSGTQQMYLRNGNVLIIESLQQSKNAFLCWIRTCHTLVPRTSPSRFWFLSSMAHMLGTIGKFVTHSFLLSLTQCLMPSWQSQTPHSIFLVKGNYISLSIEARVSYLPVPTLTFHNVHVMACIAQHLLV